MTFSSISFLFYFLPLTLALYYATPWKNVTLLAASLIFYAWGEPVFVFLFLASIVCNHVFAVAIARNGSIPLFWAAVALNISIIAWFKYAVFFTNSLASALAPLGIDLRLENPPHMPIGISFFTFQAVSLLIDVKRGDSPPPRSILDTGLYIAAFPQLIAGPIVRFKSICEQIAHRGHSFDKFSDGAMIFTLGLAQKALLANAFAPIADAAFDRPAGIGLTAVAAWTGLLAYSLQIFFDFAGYSNMAVGMGRMFGFEFPRNFNFPYTSQSLTEFWRRWHMTLSQWFRDYLYIPLGGNRGSPWRTYRNLWIVFILCGLWHGASLNFVLWGAWHGSFLVLERVFLLKRLEAAPAALRHLYLALVVMLGWTIFRAETLSAVADYWACLVGISGNASNGLKDIAADGAPTIFAIGGVVALWPLIGRHAVQVAAGFARPQSRIADLALFLARQSALAALLIGSAASIAGGVYNPFIYFRF
jgi:alginate O-acetyltransferase complex protein AlgI